MAYRNHEDKHKNYLLNREIRIAQAKARNKWYLPLALEYVKSAKDKPCEDCGHRYPYFVMDLDHVRGTKSIAVSEAAARGWSLKRLQSEIDKCDVVCANCHRLRTFKYGNPGHVSRDGYKFNPNKAVMEYLGD